MTRGIIYTRPTGGQYAFAKIDGYAYGAPTATQKQDMRMCWWAIEVDDYEATLRALRNALVPMQLDGFPGEYQMHPQVAKDLLKVVKGTPIAPENDIRHGVESYEGGGRVAIVDEETLPSRQLLLQFLDENREAIEECERSARETPTCIIDGSEWTLEDILKEKARIVEHIMALEDKAGAYELQGDEERKAEVLENIDNETSRLMELEFQQNHPYDGESDDV